MSIIPTRARLAVVAVLAAAAIGSASPAQAQTPADCDVRLERLQAQFYDMESRRGWETASEWWQARWHAYFQSCVIH